VAILVNEDDGPVVGGVSLDDDKCDRVFKGFRASRRGLRGRRVCRSLRTSLVVRVFTPIKDFSCSLAVSS